MIFFSIPSVGQLKPETLFGSDDHFGFIETLLGEEYKRNEVIEKCIKYYDKENRRYWDQIITLVNFFALKRLDHYNKFTNIPLVAFVSDQYDLGKKIYSDILFDYLLCQWQFPHPILTKNIDQYIKDIDLSISKQRENYPITKPYSVILSILKELFLRNQKDAYLTNEEFYWLGFYYYKNEGRDFNIINSSKIVEELLFIRKNGWSSYDKIRTLDQTRTHLSYPKGFLRNSSVLTSDKELYPHVDELFIGIKTSNNIIAHIDNLISLSSDYFEFNRKRSMYDVELTTSYCDFIYNPNRFSQWLSNSLLYGGYINDFKTVEENIPTDIEGYQKIKISKQLNRIVNLDRESIVRRRAEQFLLRRYIVKNDNIGKCAICNNDYPIRFLATAHIKKRSECTNEEKRDFNVVMPACHFGCDKLYEEGYIIVNEGVLESNVTYKNHTSSITSYISKINKKECSFYKNDNKKYFDYHAKKNLQFH